MTDGNQSDHIPPRVSMINVGEAFKLATGVITGVAAVLISMRSERKLLSIVLFLTVWLLLLIFLYNMTYRKNEAKKYINTFRDIPLIIIGILIGFLFTLPISKEVRGYLQEGLSGTFTPTPSYTMIPAAETNTSTPTTLADTPIPIKEPTNTPTTTPSHTPTLTPTSTLTLSPEKIVKGTCDKNKPPCIYYYAETWNELTSFLFASNDKCRWPEIADLNRKPDGHYRVPLQAESIMMVANPATFPSLISDNKLHWKYIPSCQESNQELPCLMTIPDGIFGSHMPVYKLLAEEIYGVDDDIFAKAIIEANLASDCKNTPKELSPGDTVVIPYRPTPP